MSKFKQSYGKVFVSTLKERTFNALEIQLAEQKKAIKQDPNFTKLLSKKKLNF